MNVVLISEGGAISQGLQSQFGLRGRTMDIVSASALTALDEDKLINACVIDTGLVSGTARPVLDADELTALILARQRFYARCAEQDAKLLLLSDGRVFDGMADDPHQENIAPVPTSAVGEQLRRLEDALLVAAPTGVVLRTSALISTLGDDFLGHCLAAFRRGQSLTLDHSVPACPTAVPDLARVVSGMVDQLSCGANCSGIYHYASSGQSTAYEFAEVVYAFASQLLDLPISEEQALSVGDAAEGWHPLVPLMRCDAVLFDFGIKQLPWRSYLPKMIKTLCEELAK